MKIVADDKIPFLRGALEPFAEVVYIPGKQISKYDLTDADALLIRTRTKCTESLLKGTKIRFIGTATIGFDHIDTQYCESQNITWTNAPGCNSSSVQQYIAASLFRISKTEKIKLKHKTLGIIGVGNVGTKVEKLARAIGMNVLLNDPPRERVEGAKNFQSLYTVLSESDIVTVHVPLNLLGRDFTYHLFNEENFGKLKRGAWIINSSRGEVAETQPLKNALREGGLAGAILDVWENEPDIDRDLMELALISTPHIAGYSADGKANGTAMVVNSLGKYFSLPFNNWYPGNVPLPVAPIISINCNGKSEEEILMEAINHSYNIDEDDSKLRNSPADFEKLRGEYPLRREFTSYIIDLIGGPQEVRQILSGIGFRIKG